MGSWKEIRGETGWEHPHSPLDMFCSSLFLFEVKQRPRGHMESLGCDYDYGWLRQDLQPVSRGQGWDGTSLQLVQKMACRLQAIATCLNLPAFLAWGRQTKMQSPGNPRKTPGVFSPCQKVTPDVQTLCFLFKRLHPFTRLLRASKSPVPS